MSDETSPPFSGFRNARPARKTPVNESATMEFQSEPGLTPEQRANGFEPDPPKRKRRTRAEIEAATLPATAVPDDLAVLKVCLKALRTLEAHNVKRVMLTLQAVFG